MNKRLRHLVYCKVLTYRFHINANVFGWVEWQRHVIAAIFFVWGVDWPYYLTSFFSTKFLSGHAVPAFCCVLVDHLCHLQDRKKKRDLEARACKVPWPCVCMCVSCARVCRWEQKSKKANGQTLALSTTHAPHPTTEPKKNRFSISNLRGTLDTSPHYLFSLPTLFLVCCSGLLETPSSAMCEIRSRHRLISLHPT